MWPLDLFTFKIQKCTTFHIPWLLTFRFLSFCRFVFIWLHGQDQRRKVWSDCCFTSSGSMWAIHDIFSWSLLTALLWYSFHRTRNQFSPQMHLACSRSWWKRICSTALLNELCQTPICLSLPLMDLEHCGFILSVSHEVHILHGVTHVRELVHLLWNWSVGVDAFATPLDTLAQSYRNYRTYSLQPFLVHFLVQCFGCRWYGMIEGYSFLK